MKQLRFFPIPLWLAVCALVAFFRIDPAQAADSVGLQAQLIWGTNDPESPDPKHKPIDVELAKKLEKSPFRWKHYFEVNRQTTVIATGATNVVNMSAHSKFEVRSLGGDRVEIKLYGQGKHIGTHSEKLMTDWPVILSGDAKNDTAWLVVITKVDPATVKASPAVKPK